MSYFFDDIRDKKAEKWSRLPLVILNVLYSWTETFHMSVDGILTIVGVRVLWNKDYLKFHTHAYRVPLE